MIQTQFRFPVLKTPLDPVSRQGHPQQRGRPRSLRSVRPEVLHVRVLQRVPGHRQMLGLAGQIAVRLGMEANAFDLPEARSLPVIVESMRRPRHVAQRRMSLQQFVGTPGVRFAADQTRLRPRSAAAVRPVRPLGHPRTHPPPAHALGNLGHPTLPTRCQSLQKLRLAALAFVERQPVEPHPVGHRPIVLFPTRSATSDDTRSTRECPPLRNARGRRPNSRAKTDRRRAGTGSPPACSPDAP